MEWQESLENKYRKKLPASLIEIQSAEEGGPGTSRREIGPLRTEADRTNDARSLNRLLDRSLFLLMKGKGGPILFAT